MDFPTSIKTCYQKYATFEGRASRSEFWFFHLYAFLVFMGVVMAAVPVLIALKASQGAVLATIALALLALLFALFIPIVSVSVRRVHDTGAPGGWVFVWYIPNIGGLVALVWGCIPGDPAENRFGPDPLLEDRQAS